MVQSWKDNPGCKQYHNWFYKNQAIMDLNEEYTWYRSKQWRNRSTYKTRYPAHDCTKSIKSIDVPNPKVNKENLLSGLSYLEQT